jgi:hypothetical protein
MRRLLSRNFAAHPGGLESDARSLLFDLENAETEKPCPARARHRRIDAVRAGGNASPHRV